MLAQLVFTILTHYQLGKPIAQLKISTTVATFRDFVQWYKLLFTLVYSFYQVLQ